MSFPWAIPTPASLVQYQICIPFLQRGIVAAGHFSGADDCCPQEPHNMNASNWEKCIKNQMREKSENIVANVPADNS
jgi:hypothetical protein